ncbi:hypothetical protein C6Y40_15380 [Alteromonas alba]|uniref:Dipeptidylpeptidase IV N-terminal domain-containing protein n=1 Tax=Alteromonas alba TaxID=2079529 RepID=A0A2S9V898_9ALTE|nr:DPP IV N-terminal domain-containing protein [Alteromonas alba]PRO72691.1 hypothetical protein C6Y40_15380 [Alteromonas alba]
MHFKNALLAIAFIMLSTIAFIAPSQAKELTVDQIFDNKAFKSERSKSASWLKDGSGYSLIEKSDTVKDGFDANLYDPATGKKTTLIKAEDLIPTGTDKPLKIEDFTWSDDGSLALIYTNSLKVWRYKTQGDYWILNRETKALHKVGKKSLASSLMFAKFSPDGTKIAYVQKIPAKNGKAIHDIYVEGVDGKKRKRLTKDGSMTIFNGTFDWVYEEELSLRDGFRWSPDSKKIAYWQLDSSKVRDFTMINNTDAKDNYPTLHTFSYPKVGETNSAARIGVVSARGGKTKWMNIPGDKRNHYLAWMEWAANSTEIAVQQLNRRQNTNRLFYANAKSGKATNIFTDKDDAWLNPVTDFTWLNDGAEFLWVSEAGGWRQILRVSRDGKTVKNITPGAFDVTRIRRIDTKGGYVYFDASPTDPQRMYLYRVAIDGSSKAERLTPQDQIGIHSYQISHDGKWAFHSWSNRSKVSTKHMVSLPDHKKLNTISGFW